MKDRIIKFILKSVMLGWIFFSQVCMLAELFYGKSLILAFVFCVFSIQGLTLYIKASIEDVDRKIES